MGNSIKQSLFNELVLIRKLKHEVNTKEEYDDLIKEEKRVEEELKKIK